MLPDGFELGQHRIAVQQGNTLTEESIRNLRAGMDAQQVLFLLGTPLVKDAFHPDRWDYPLYVEAKESGEKSRLDVVSLRFKEGKLEEVRRLVPINPEVASVEPGGQLDAAAEWFELGDALVADKSPEPAAIDGEVIAEPEQTHRD